MAAFLALSSPATSLAITEVRVVDVEAAAVSAPCNVVIQGDSIISVGAAAPPGAVRVSGKGKYLIPGLWDMHVHWYDKETLSLFTANGVTGIREMFGNRELLAWRDAIESGKMAGPRMVVGSPIIDGPKPFWKTSLPVGTEAEGRATLRRVRAAGYDFAKVYSFLPPVAYQGIMEEARALGYPVDGHVPHRVSVGAAAAAGQRCAEHLYGFAVSSARREKEFRSAIERFLPKGNNGVMDAMWYMTDAIAASLDPEKETKLLDEVVNAEMYQCPTLVVLHSLANRGDPAFRKHPHIKYMFKSAVDTFWKRDDASKEELIEERAAFKRKLELVGRMQTAGVRIVAGSDVYNPYTFPGFSLHDELQLFVKAGMTPAHALATATVNPARMLKKDSVMGAVKPRYVADVVLLDANPLTDIKNTMRIHAVIQRGRLFSRKQLDTILRKCELRMREK